LKSLISIALSFLDYFPIILISLMLYRQKIKFYVKEILLFAIAGALAAHVFGPIVYIFSTGMLLTFSLRFPIVSSLIISLSGYVLSALVSTAALAAAVSEGIFASPQVSVHPETLAVQVLLTLPAKLLLVLVLYKCRFGFTFLAPYTKISFNKSNIGFFMFIAVVLCGVLLRTLGPKTMWNFMMPFQMLCAAAALLLVISVKREWESS